MRKFTVLLKFISIVCLHIFAQGCTKDSPSPEIRAKSIENQSLSNSKKTKQGILFERQKHKISGGNTISGGTTIYRLQQETCYDIYDVYYNIYTGEVVDRVYIGRECTGGTSSPGGSDGGSPSGGGTTPGVNDGSGVSQSVIDNLPPCAGKILSNLMLSAVNGGTSATSNLIDNILNAVQRPNACIVLKFKDGAITDDNGKPVAANTVFDRAISQKNGINQFTITLNSSFLYSGQNSSATDLFIAKTILHETLHAALMDWALSNGSSTNGMNFDALLGNYMSTQGLTPGDGQGQHDAMSLLVNDLGEALYTYYSSIDHSSSLGSQNMQATIQQDCTYLCWSGLQGSIGYQWAVSHQAGFKDKCDAIREAERTGTWQKSGLEERFPAGADPCP